MLKRKIRSLSLQSLDSQFTKSEKLTSKNQLEIAKYG